MEASHFSLIKNNVFIIEDIVFSISDSSHKTSGIYGICV